MPGSTLISVTVPACGAVTVCCIFMASRTRTTSPGGDLRPGLDGDLTTVPGHRREQGAARDRVGGVGEAGQRATGGPGGGSMRPSRTPGPTSERRPRARVRDPADLERRRRRTAASRRGGDVAASRRRRRRRLHAVGTSNTVRCGCDTTLRQPTGRRAGPCGRRGPARRARARRRRQPGRTSAEVPAVAASCARRSRCSSSPARNSSSRSTRRAGRGWWRRRAAARRSARRPAGEPPTAGSAPRR